LPAPFLMHQWTRAASTGADGSDPLLALIRSKELRTPDCRTIQGVVIAAYQP